MKSIVKVSVANGGLFDGNIIGGTVVLPRLSKEFCIIGIIDVAPMASIDVVATATIKIPLIMWFIVICFI